MKWSFVALLVAALVIQNSFAQGVVDICDDTGSSTFNGGKNGTSRITSPGYPDLYPEAQNCSVLIQADVGYVVVLEFEGVFEIEDGSGCEFDSLRIIDGTEDFVTCGNKRPDTYVSVGNAVRIIFFSDETVTAAGFAFRWSILPAKETTSTTGRPTIFTTEPMTTEHIESTTTAHLTFTTIAPYIDICDSSTLEDGKFNGGKNGFGIITSPDYPERYPADLNCSVLIEADVGYVVVLEFDAFDLEASSDCRFDSLRIIDEIEDFKSCGNDMPDTYVSVGNTVRIIFSTDLYDSEEGFVFTWHVELAKETTSTTGRPAFFTTEPMTTEHIERTTTAYLSFTTIAPYIGEAVGNVQEIINRIVSNVNPFNRLLSLWWKASLDYNRPAAEDTTRRPRPPRK